MDRANVTPIKAEALDDDEHLPILPLLPEAEAFPVTALPLVLREAVESIATLRQVPPAMAVQSVLSVASLACQPFANVRTPANVIAPLSLFAVTLAVTGARKSAADNNAMEPVKLYEADLRDSHDMQREAYDIAIAVYEAQRKTIAANKKMSPDERRYEIEQLGTKPEPPLRPVMTVADVTLEALLKLWPEMPGSLGLFSSDGGTFLGGWSVKGDGKLLAAAALSTIWDGRAYHRMRAGDGMSSLYGRRLALHLMIQPDAALEFLSDPTFKAQGLHARILLVFPPSLIGQRIFDDDAQRQTNKGSIASKKLDRFSDHLHKILSQPWPLAERSLNELDPRMLELDDDAVLLWIDFYNEVEKQCGHDGKYADLAGFAEKAGEMVCRIAGIFALIEQPVAETVSDQIMLRAIVVMEWYLAENLRVREWASSARIIAAKTGEANAAYAFDKAAQKLLEWVRKEADGAKVFGITRKRIMQFGPAETRQARTLSVALSCLMDAGYINPPDPNEKQHRPPVTFNLW